MNTTQHRSAWGVALAAFALAMVTACGSEIATPTGDIGNGVDNNKPTVPRSSCFGSADHAEWACAEDGAPGGGPRTSGSGFGPQ